MEFERDTTFFGAILKHLAYTLSEINKVGLLTVQLHLLLVNLTNIEDLVHQIQDTLGIVVNSINVTLCLRMVSTYMTLQVGQRTHDERQRRANIVSGVNQEFHLFLIQVLIGSASVVQQHKNHYSNNYCQINAVSQCGAIPRCLHSDSHRLHRRIIVTLLCPHLNAIGTWLKMTQRKVVDASRISDPIAIVHPILQEYVRWVVEVHL